MRRKINFFVCGENQIHVWAAELVQQAPLPNAHGSDQDLHAKTRWSVARAFAPIPLKTESLRP